jgi:ATP-dependent helicase HrpA
MNTDAIELNYPAELPVCALRADIIAALDKHQVVIVSGDTGSGKTTQLPKMALELGRGGKGKRIVCTQPRRLAAVTMAERVAAELNGEIGNLVGYRHRFARRIGAETRIEFATDGILLAETRNDPLLRAYDTVIVDEAHERSLNIDFLLGILKRALERRKDLKVIVSSATLDTDRFAAFFRNAATV